MIQVPQKFDHHLFLYKFKFGILRKNNCFRQNCNQNTKLIRKNYSRFLMFELRLQCVWIVFKL